MLTVNKEIINLDKLENHIKKVNMLLEMRTNKNFQTFLQNKCMETLEKVMNERLTGGTTNDDEIELYKSSNHIQETTEGFIIYNDAKVPTSNINDYPNGYFSIALAFEYGVGIVGEGTYNGDRFTAWEYNINKYNFGWYFKDKNGQKKHTYGYMGFEIYRFTAIEIEKNISKWINEYYSKEVLKNVG